MVLRCATKDEVAGRAQQQEFSPAVDICDKGDEIVLVADMPGVSVDNLDIHLDRGSLSIRGRIEAPVPSGTLELEEYQVGDFARTFTVNEEFDPSGIQAGLKDGVLTLRMKKPSERSPLKIPVKTG